MTTLVTGATGFLGSALVRLLRARGEAVRVLVRETSDRRRIEGLDAEVAVGDVTEGASVERAMEGAAAVYHVAALYELGTKDPARMRRINVDGTRHVLEAAHARGALAIHVSSVVALGPTGTTPACETHRDDGDSRSPYEATKREAHVFARELAARGARVRIALPATIYGPDDPSLTGKFHAMYARGVVRVGALEEMTMSLVHVDDCAEGLVCIAERGKDGEAYVLCGQAVTMREWMGALARATGRRAPRVWLPSWAVRRAGPWVATVAPLAGFSRALVREGLAMADDVHWAFTAAKARRDLGWEARPLDEGLRTVARFHGR
jgi:nucleoside-diphosphate-sugar epimerase